MAIFSKLLGSRFVPYTCYELNHTWTPYCSRAAWDILFSVWKQALKMYTTLYVITALIRRKGLKYWKHKILTQVLQSTLFLAINGSSFMVFMCLWSKFLGMDGTYTTFLIPAILSSFVAICTERENRRPALAGYVANVTLYGFGKMCLYQAVETLYRMVRSRGYVHDIAFFEVALFSVVAAGFMYLFRLPDGLSPSTRNLISFVVGSDECSKKEPRAISEPQQGSSIYAYLHPRLRSIVVKATSWWQRQYEALPTCLTSKHHLCQHHSGCLVYLSQGFFKMFGLGCLVQCALSLVKSITRSKRPSISMLTDSWKLATFLGSFNGVFRMVSCCLRRWRQRDSPIHGLVAGFLAGASMAIYRSSGITMYLAFKLIEIVYSYGMRSGRLPTIPYIDVIIYSIATGIIFHAGMIEPHNLRPSYWRFIQTVTECKSDLMNRRLMDIYGTHASTLFPNFWPAYDPGFTSITTSPSDRK